MSKKKNKKKKDLFFFFLFPVNKKKNGRFLVSSFYSNTIPTFPMPSTQTSSASHAAPQSRASLWAPSASEQPKGQRKRNHWDRTKWATSAGCQAPKPPCARAAPPLPGQMGGGDNKVPPLCTAARCSKCKCQTQGRRRGVKN